MLSNLSIEIITVIATIALWVAFGLRLHADSSAKPGLIAGAVLIALFVSAVGAMGGYMGGSVIDGLYIAVAVSISFLSLTFLP